MAEFSYPFDTGAGASVTQDMWSRMAKYWARPAPIGDSSGTRLKVTAPGTGLTTSVSPGEAPMLGYFYRSDAAITVTHTANSSGSPRVDTVVLRLEIANDNIHVVTSAVPGTPALNPTPLPIVGDWEALTQSVFEMPLAYVTVASGATAITSANVVEARWAGSAAHTTGTSANRPDWSIRFRPMGTMHFDSDLRQWVGWDGTKWGVVAQQGPWKTWTPVANWDDGSTNGVNDPNWATLGRYKLLADNTCAITVQAKTTVGLANPPGVSGTPSLRISLPFKSANWASSNDTQFSTYCLDGAYKRQGQGTIWGASNYVNRLLMTDDTTKHLEFMVSTTNFGANAYIRYSCVYEIDGL